LLRPAGKIGLNAAHMDLKRAIGNDVLLLLFAPSVPFCLL
jgi:hypothetical protein